jgi:hypothetical protein
MKAYLFTLLVLISFAALAQNSLSISPSGKSGYKKWTAYTTSLGFGLGTQKAFFSELGLSRHMYFYTDLGYASKAYYTSLEWVPRFSTASLNVYGIKAGYEINLRVLALGVEAKYQTDFDSNDLVITPKIGLGVMGIVNLFYGYDISTNKSPFAGVRHQQFSLVGNFNKQFFKNAKIK